jgi:hypothetical protein
MSRKRVARSFEDFSGIDLVSTKITTDPTSALTLKNWRFGEIPGLKSRFGVSVIGNAGAFKGIGEAYYFNPTTGATQEDVL